MYRVCIVFIISLLLIASATGGVSCIRLLARSICRAPNALLIHQALTPQQHHRRGLDPQRGYHEQKYALKHPSLCALNNRAQSQYQLPPLQWAAPPSPLKRHSRLCRNLRQRLLYCLWQYDPPRPGPPLLRDHILRRRRSDQEFRWDANIIVQRQGGKIEEILVRDVRAGLTACVCTAKVWRWGGGRGGD